MQRLKSPEVPTGFPIWPEQQIKGVPTQGRFHIPGDPNLAEREPVRVFRSDLQLFEGKELVLAGTAIDGNRAHLIEGFLWRLKIHRLNLQVLESMEILRRADPKEPMWGKFVRRYRGKDRQLHQEILEQVIDLQS